jgi:sirohydrochlorin cobaltochelatase
MSEALILFSHGSLLCGAGEQLKAHAARLSETGKYACVEIGYLNYTEPSFAQAVEKSVKAGATRITIAPYFLVPGYFVNVGLPRVLNPEKERFPDVEFRIAPVLGDHPLLADAVLSCAERAASSGSWRSILHAAPQYCEKDPDCPLFEKCSRSEILPAISPAIPIQRQCPAETAALLLMVHGSPNPESNADVFRVAELVRQKHHFSAVTVAFMECNDPDIPTAIDALVGGGIQSITAVPFFLHAGKHVADDLPTLLEEAQERYNGVEFLLGEYLGCEPLVSQVLLERLQELPV